MNKMYIRNKWIYHTPQLKLDECVDNAMSEYAQQEAIAFNIWCLINCMLNDTGGGPFWVYEGKAYDFCNDIPALYQIYKSQSTK